MSNLSKHFTGVMAKQLSAVEADRNVSHQHEFNGTKAMKQVLGTSRRNYEAQFIYIGVDDEDRESAHDTVTWYDARENHPTRSEHRLYFRNNEVMAHASEGDILISALHSDGSMLLLVISEESPILGQVLWLFDIPENPGNTFVTITPDPDLDKSSSVFYYIAEEAGIELEEPENDDWLDLLLSRFGPTFPRTKDLSALALETLTDHIDAVHNPDITLLSLVDREELLFRQLERHIVSKHLEEHAASWSDDVDSFVKYSLGVHNRRKSRAGHALENHLEWLFSENSIEFDRGAKTENRSKPDFLFPGRAQYIDNSFPSELLTMLGVKTSCKDRWRQVLNEAKRIPDKHLLTLEPAISEHQTNEMREAHLTLVLPASLHNSYTENQRQDLLNVQDFLHLLHERQT